MASPDPPRRSERNQGPQQLGDQSANALFAAEAFMVRRASHAYRHHSWTLAKRL